MRQLTVMLIRADKRWISPYKGFNCAYRGHTGDDMLDCNRERRERRKASPRARSTGKQPRA